MAHKPGNPVLEHLRTLRREIAELRKDEQEVKARLDDVVAQGTGFSRRLDRLDDQVTRIERRPELSPGAAFYAHLAKDCGSDLDLEAAINENRKAHPGPEL